MNTQLLQPPDEDVDQLHEATAIYTVSGVVNGLLDRLSWPSGDDRLLDPSTGDGSFLIEAIKRLDISRPDQLSRLKGWEIHPGAANQARRSLSSYLQERGYSKKRADRHAARIVMNRDFLTEGPAKERFNVIAGNPPYLCFRRLPSYFKRIYTDALPPYTRGDILYAFLDSCANLLTPDGKIGLVCSDRFLINDTTAELRRRLGQRVGISHLARLNQKSAFYRPKHRVRNSPPRIHPVEILLQSPALSLIQITEHPLSPDAISNSCDYQGRTLSDVATISLAPWIGPTGIFVIDAITADQLRGHAELTPVIDTEDIDRTTDTIKTASRYLIRTSAMLKPSSVTIRHLKARLHLMPPRGRRATFWLPPETPKLSIDQPSLLIPRIARRLRVIDLPPGLMPINHNLSIVSAGRLALSEIKELLLSERSQNWIRANSPQLEDGYLSITTKRLRRLPIYI